MTFTASETELIIKLTAALFFFAIACWAFRSPRKTAESDQLISSHDPEMEKVAIAVDVDISKFNGRVRPATEAMLHAAMNKSRAA